MTFLCSYQTSNIISERLRLLNPTVYLCVHVFVYICCIYCIIHVHVTKTRRKKPHSLLKENCAHLAVLGEATTSHVREPEKHFVYSDVKNKTIHRQDSQDFPGLSTMASDCLP